MLPIVCLLFAPPAMTYEVRAAGKPPVTTPTPTLATDTVSICRTGARRPSWPSGPHLILTNGDRVAAKVVGGDSRAVWVQTAYTGGNATDRLVIPFAAVAVVWFVTPPADVPPDPARYPWADGPKRTDAALLADGDVRRGLVEAFAAGGVRLGKLGLLPTAKLQAVAFDPSLSKSRPGTGRRVRAVLTDGSRLTFGTATLDDGSLRGKLLAGPEVAIPSEQLVTLEVLGGPAVYLSDLKPVRQSVEGYTGLAWPPVADRSAKGLPLQIGGDTFDKGIGTHPKTVLTYTLGGKYRRFEAVVGPDPVTGRDGTADVRILADGKDVTPSGVRGLVASTAVDLDVTGVKELTLEIGYGSFGGVRADVNWGDARLVE